LGGGGGGAVRSGGSEGMRGRGWKKLLASAARNPTFPPNFGSVESFISRQKKNGFLEGRRRFCGGLVAAAAPGGLGSLLQSDSRPRLLLQVGSAPFFSPMQALVHRRPHFLVNEAPESSLVSIVGYVIRYRSWFFRRRILFEFPSRLFPAKANRPVVVSSMQGINFAYLLPLNCWNHQLL
jgi:hypothetical protein